MNESKNDFIENLRCFIDVNARNLENLKLKLDWTQSESKCPHACKYKRHANISNKNIDRHLVKCSFSSNEDYTDFFKQNTIENPHKIEIDNNTLSRILQTQIESNNRIFVNNLIPQERLLVYEYALNSFRESNLPSFTKSNQTFLDLNELKISDKDDSNNKTYNEMLSEIRNRKRRPKSYRKQKRTQMDKIRDLIETQMDVLIEINKQSEKMQSHHERQENRHLEKHKL